MAGKLIPIPARLNAAAVLIGREANELFRSSRAAAELKFGFRDSRSGGVPKFILRVRYGSSRAVVDFREAIEGIWYLRGVRARLQVLSMGGLPVERPDEFILGHNFPAADRFYRKGLTASGRLCRNVRARGEGAEPAGLPL